MVSSNVLVTNLKYPHLKGKPHWRRTIAVYTALDKAPDGYSYSQLRSWVKKETGKGCSRKLIRKWKAEKRFKLVNNSQILVNNYQLSANNYQSPVISHQSLVNNSQSLILSQSEKLQNNYQQKSSIVNFELPVINEQINHQKDLPLYFEQSQLPLTHQALHSSLFCLKKLCKIASLTVVFLGINFIFTPKDSTVCLDALNSEKCHSVESHSKIAIAESSPITPTFEYQHKPKSVEPNSIKINLTITDPKDLKVKPGDEVIKGQIISDRTTERQRLLNQRKQLELSLKKLTIPIPTIQDPNPIAKLPLLPPISYQQEQANIQLKEQQHEIAVQAVSNQQEKIDSLRQLSTRKVSSNNNYHSQITSNQSSSNQPSVNNKKVDSSSKKLATNFNYVDINGKPVNSNQKTFTIKTAEHQPNITIKPPLETNKINNTSNSTITVKAIQETQQPSNNSQSAITINPTQKSQKSNTNSLTINNINYSNINSKLKVIIEHETVILNQLKGNQEKAKRELQIAKSQLETAKEQRRYAEHQLYLENNRRAIALQQQGLELERQRTIRAGQLQEQEYSKTQIEAKIIEIDNAINQLSTVKIPYNGTIKKVKWTGQTDHTLNVTVTLDVDDSSVSEK